jgi:hypothetical protein
MILLEECSLILELHSADFYLTISVKRKTEWPYELKVYSLLGSAFHHIPKDSNINAHSHENIKSHVYCILLNEH